MLTSHIGTVLKQGLTTFASKSEMFYQNLEILKALLEKTTVDDVSLPQQFQTNSLWERKDKAPVTYVDIYEDENLTMGIFILKPGMKLPLHNHPHMHGLIKVLFGKLKITSYSLNTEKTKEITTSRNQQQTSNYFQQIVTVERDTDLIADSNSNCCVLEPEKRNLHEIQTLDDSPAAFLDILAPPYDTMSTEGVRRCNYYQVGKEVGANVFRLHEIPVPSWYWSDSFPYTGPDLSS